MKLALLSDLHANRRALDACLAHARAAGATRLAFLGDLVGYGAEPREVTERVMHLAADGALVVRGNHDQAAAEPPARMDTIEAQSAQWTHGQLDAAHRSYLSGLPLTLAVDGALLVHASAEAPGQWAYLTNTQLVRRSLDAAETAHGARRVFCGHVHEQHLYYRGRNGAPMAFQPAEGVAIPVGTHRHWLALVGSVGQPRDGDTRAMYALFDVAQSRLVFHRVAYDHLGAAAAVRRAGLPEAFARRLEQGQ